MEQKAQEKLKQINRAFELLEKFFADNETNPEPAQDKTKVPRAEDFFAQGQSLFFGDGIGGVRL